MYGELIKYQKYFRKNAPPTMEELVEKEQHAKLIGQLK